MTDIITFEEQWIQRVIDGKSQMIYRTRIQGMTHWEESIVPLHLSPVIILSDVTDLLRGGWDCIHHDIWRSPSGQLFRGPHYAWHIWAGTPMCEPR